MSKRAKLITAVLVTAGLLVVALAGAAFADGPNGPGVNSEDCLGQGWGHHHGLGTTNAEVVSELTGLTPDEIHAQRQEGKSLVEIAAAQGVNEDALVEAIMAAKKEVVQAKVAAGALTQEQADLMLQQMEQRTQQAVNRTTVGPPDWSRGNGQGACSDETRAGIGPSSMHRWARSSS